MIKVLLQRYYNKPPYPVKTQVSGSRVVACNGPTTPEYTHSPLSWLLLAYRG
jgi:hypothetical protein